MQWKEKEILKIVSFEVMKKNQTNVGKNKNRMENIFSDTIVFFLLKTMCWILTKVQPSPHLLLSANRNPSYQEEYPAS